MLVEFNLTNKVIVYVKMVLNSSTIAFTSIVLVVFALVILYQKYVLPMKLKLVWVWKKLVWKMPIKLFLKRQSLRLSSRGVDMNGKRFGMSLVVAPKIKCLYENMFSFQGHSIPINLCYIAIKFIFAS
jgi:hypothetical protein